MAESFKKIIQGKLIRVTPEQYDYHGKKYWGANVICPWCTMMENKLGPTAMPSAKAAAERTFHIILSHWRSNHKSK